jgi:hypothetical protein
MERNQCDRATLHCIADYYIFTNQTDFPLDVCVYYQETCKQYCRDCEKSSVPKYKSCYSEKWHLLGGLKSEDIKIKKDK